MTYEENRPGQEESRRTAIVDAAARVFAEKGFSGASNRDIAREAGISPGLIYWYFQDKNDLFRAVVSRLFPVQRAELLDEGVEDVSLPDLFAMAGRHFLGVLTHPDVLRLIRLMLSELPRFPDVFSQMGPLTGDRVLGPLSEQLDARVARGEIPPIDSHLVAQAYFGSLVAFVLRKYIFRSPDLGETPDDEMIQTVAHIFTGGLMHGAVPGHGNGARE